MVPEDRFQCEFCGKDFCKSVFTATQAEARQGKELSGCTTLLTSVNVTIVNGFRKLFYRLHRLLQVDHHRQYHVTMMAKSLWK